MLGRRPEVERSGFGDAATAAAAAGEATAHVWGRADASTVGREEFSGFCEQPLPVGAQLPPGPFHLCGAGVFVPILPGRLQNLEKWILTLAGLTETLVKPESMRGSLRSLGYASLCSQLLRARQVSRGAGETAGLWVPLEAWFLGPGWEEV